MAVDSTDGCLPSKQAVLAGEMDGSQASCQPSQSQDLTSQLNTQPATQPLDSSLDLDSSSQAGEECSWGQLYPHCGTFPRLPLQKDIFRLGRASSSDYVIRESDMGSYKWLSAVSKTQCEITKCTQGVFLKDRSSNGTWVNGHRVGRDQMWPLEHNAEICFAGPNKKVFVFMSAEAGESFPEELTSRYTVSKVLGRGATGEVRLGFRIPDLHRVAIKIICKRTTITNTNNSNIMNEVKILQAVSHPCIINLEHVIDSQDYLYIVLELAEGGELFDKIIEKTKFNESEAKVHFYQICSAIEYLHSKNICHRDLKPENVLLCSVDDSNPIIKITDMGLSKLVDLGSVLKTFCGTPQYIAPEVLPCGTGTSSSYSLKADTWSLGVILFILLSGSPPFSEERQETCGKSLRDQILSADFVFYKKLFDQISGEAKDLISKLLTQHPDKRLSASEIMKHPWLQDPAVVRRVEALMAVQQQKGRKRLDRETDEMETETLPEKKVKRDQVDGVSIFKTPR